LDKFEKSAYYKDLRRRAEEEEERMRGRGFFD
jgi:hypothetical protein